MTKTKLKRLRVRAFGDSAMIYLPVSFIRHGQIQIDGFYDVELTPSQEVKDEGV